MTGEPLRKQPASPQLLAQLDALLVQGEPPLTLMANMASLLYWSLPDINWIGFYLLDDDQLYLGPFHGKPACSVLPLGKGVCGTVALNRRLLNVPDVGSFPGHISCDDASQSELVLPLQYGSKFWGVLDVDSPVPERFDKVTQDFFEQAAAMLAPRLGIGPLFSA
ncbi:MAG: GAF domain-containing protein [Bacteroidetes bacterium]|nr:GAF domain-containing protein [Bacteroidota bacterium]